LIRLKYCTVYIEPYGCLTMFDDGASVSSWAPASSSPSTTLREARACQFDKLIDYVRDRDLSHSFIAEQFSDTPSRLLWARAHKLEIREVEAISERRRVYRWQRYVHAGRRPDKREAWAAAKIAYRALLVLHGLPLGEG
jgi:hypothetical protein